MLLRALTIGLTGFRCIDACQADLVLCPAGVEKAESVAVAHADHVPGERVGVA
jgi:hypothetical protein